MTEWQEARRTIQRSLPHRVELGYAMFGQGRDPGKAEADVAAQVARERGYGGHSMVAPLLRVMVQEPVPPLAPDDHVRFGYPRPVDHARAVAEHRAFCAILEGEGIEVVRQPPAAPGALDAIFVYDPSMVTDEGAVIGRPGKEPRRSESQSVVDFYRALEIPILARIEGPGVLEMGDLFWIDEYTLAAGEGFRTNAAALDELGIRLQPFSIDIIRMPLPYWHGPAECLHLLSLISPIDEGLAVAYLPLLGVNFVRALQAAGWKVVPVPDEEFATQGANVLALGPRKALVLAGNPITRERLERAGCEVLEYIGDEISHNRGGGPTCLTRPLLRDIAIAIPHD